MNDITLEETALRLPDNPRLARTVEFSLPGAAAIASFVAATVGAGGDYTVSQSLTVSVFAILAMVYFGSALTGLSLVVHPGVFVINGFVRSSNVRHPNIQRIVSPGVGNVVLVVKGHDDIVLRWSPLGRRYRGRHMPDEILRVYGATETVEGEALTIERRWIRWRIIYWISVITLSPAPFLLGHLVASLLSGGTHA